MAYLLLARHPELFSRAVIDGAAIVPSRLAPLLKTAVGVISPFLHRGAVTRTMGKALGVPAGDLPRFEEGMLSVAPSTFRRAFNHAQDPGVLPEVLACPVPTLLVTGERELADMHGANAALLIYKSPLARLLSTPDVGADNPLWAMDGTPGVTWQSGAYYDEHRRLPRRPNPQQDDPRLVEAMWAESARRVGLDT